LKTSDKYRFTLQWGSETEEKVQTGEILESLGNKKSEFIVMAVTEYIRLHPEAISAGQRLKIIVRPNFTREQMEEMVRRIVKEHVSENYPAQHEGVAAENQKSGGEADDGFIDTMLKNLDMFN
jgi:hypothetical protein